MLFAHLGYVVWHGLRASRGKEMQEMPFEHFIPNWFGALEEEADQSEDAREKLKTKFIAALMGAAKAPQQGQKSGKATLRPKEK